MTACATRARSEGPAAVANSLSEREEDDEGTDPDGDRLHRVDDREEFFETILESLSDEPAKYDRIEAISWGKEPLTEDAADLELGPNNCAAN